MTAPRPSAEMRALTTGEHALCLFVGLGLAASGGFFEFLEMKSPPTHTGHIIAFGIWTLFGVAVALPKQVFPIVQQIFVIAGPYIPVIGGRRASDPPKP